MTATATDSTKLPIKPGGQLSRTGILFSVSGATRLVIGKDRRAG